MSIDGSLSAHRLIEQLEELLDQFPLSSVIRSHAGLVDGALELWRERLDMLGDPGRRYWDHPVELLYDEVGVRLGAMFVLVQAAVTETVSITKRVYELNGQAIGKKAILRLMAPVDSKTGLPYPEVADAAANYYKHRFEWPRTWAEATNVQQIATMSTLQVIGMHDTAELTDNLQRACYLIMRDSNADGIGRLSALVVEDWHEKLAAHLRKEFRLSSY